MLNFIPVNLKVVAAGNNFTADIFLCRSWSCCAVEHRELLVAPQSSLRGVGN